MQPRQLVRQDFDLIPGQGQFPHVPQPYDVQRHLLQLVLIDKQLLQPLHPLDSAEISDRVFADLQVLDIPVLGGNSADGLYLVADGLNLLDVGFLDGGGEEAELAEDLIGKTSVVEADPFFVLLEHLAKRLLDPEFLDLLVLDVDVLLAEGVGDLENYEGVPEVVFVLVGGDVVYFVEVSAFDADDVGLVLVGMPAEGLDLQLLALDEDANSELRDALVLTGDLHAVFDDFVVLEGSRDEGLRVHGGYLALSAQPKQAFLALDVVADVIVVVVVVGALAADEGSVEELKLSL